MDDTSKPGGRPVKRAAPMSFRDIDGDLLRRVEDYRVARGLKRSKAVRDLIESGLDAAAGDQVRLHELIPNLHVLIDELHQRVPRSGDFNRVMLVTVLETVMLLRQIAATTKPDLMQKAQRNANDAYQQLIKEGTA